MVLMLAASGIWMWNTGAIARAAEDTRKSFYARTAQMGFTVRATYLEGRNRTAMAAIEKALGYKTGDAILSLPLDELRARLEAIPTIRQAAVERALPHSLHIRIVEREPVAIWQMGGRLNLIDDEGAVMSDLDLKRYAQLPLVVGRGAPTHVREALGLLRQEADLAPLVQAMVRVSDRRWNVKLKTGIEIKLPQDEADKAWASVAALQRDQQLLMRDIRAIDLRGAERMTIQRSAPPAPPLKNISAKET